MTYSFLLSAMCACLIAFSVPNDKQDKTVVFYGSLDSFDNAAEVSIDLIIYKTEEYKTITKEKIKRGTGKYWILMEKASKKVKNAIEQFGKDNDYDLVVLRGYIKSVNDEIPVTDITDKIIEIVVAKK